MIRSNYLVQTGTTSNNKDQDKITALSALYFGYPWTSAARTGREVTSLRFLAAVLHGSYLLEEIELVCENI